MKEQFIKFLEANNCLNNWMVAIKDSGKNPTEFVRSNKPQGWILDAFGWSGAARKQYVDWYKIHSLWLDYLTEHKS